MGAAEAKYLCCCCCSGAFNLGRGVVVQLIRRKVEQRVYCKGAETGGNKTRRNG